MSTVACSSQQIPTNATRRPLLGLSGSGGVGDCAYARRGTSSNVPAPRVSFSALPTKPNTVPILYTAAPSTPAVAPVESICLTVHASETSSQQRHARPQPSTHSSGHHLNLSHLAAKARTCASSSSPASLHLWLCEQLRTLWAPSAVSPLASTHHRCHHTLSSPSCPRRSCLLSPIALALGTLLLRYRTCASAVARPCQQQAAGKYLFRVN